MSVVDVKCLKRFIMILATTIECVFTFLISNFKNIMNLLQEGRLLGSSFKKGKKISGGSSKSFFNIIPNE